MPTLGNQSIAIEQSLSTQGTETIPTTLQIVMRHGSTVVTLAAVGGNEIGLSNVTPIANKALTTFVQACG